MAHPKGSERPFEFEGLEAVLFDLDGVLTDTARVHAACWKQMFDEFLQQWSHEQDEPFRSFEIDTDYHQYVDGKPRYDGVRDFLTSRGIRLPDGTPDDPPALRTICGLGNRKNELVHEVIRKGGVDVYDATVPFLKKLVDRGLKLGCVTSSRNGELVLKNAGLLDFFQALVDGQRAAAEGLPGKPAPDTFLRGAQLLGVTPDRAVVLEDAISGVQAGKAGGFKWVIGVDRMGNPQALRKAGADFVVSDLSELAP